jgi:hypothetical protein
MKPGQQDAFVVVNKSEIFKEVNIHIHGSSGLFQAFRTMEGESYRDLGIFEASQGKLYYECPPRSVTTFYNK